MFNPQQALLQYSNVENSVKAENSTAYDLTKMLFDGCLKAMSLTIFHIKNKDFLPNKKQPSDHFLLMILFKM